eukprot:gb/GECG01000560.1/.p1 GENE.gb/GECG01000560.1/~~gb/GECG01000560.1/.p1  ORF type:complete len:107 (+),score=7.70 gb/GECG01000560.1/:1-321(+)
MMRPSMYSFRLYELDLLRIGSLIMVLVLCLFPSSVAENNEYDAEIEGETSQASGIKHELSYVKLWKENDDDVLYTCPRRVVPLDIQIQASSVLAQCDKGHCRSRVL